MEDENIYCGIGKIPKKKKLGTMRQCAEKKQIRYYGVKKLDPIQLKIALGNENKKAQKTRNKLIKEMGSLRGKVKLAKAKRNNKKLTEQEKAQVEKKVQEAVDKLNETVREFNNVENKIKGNKQKQKVVEKQEIKEFKQVVKEEIQQAKKEGSDIIKQANKLNKQIHQKPESLIKEILGAPSIKARMTEMKRLKEKLHDPRYAQLQKEFEHELEIEKGRYHKSNIDLEIQRHEDEYVETEKIAKKLDKEIDKTKNKNKKTQLINKYNKLVTRLYQLEKIVKALEIIRNRESHQYKREKEVKIQPIMKDLEKLITPIESELEKSLKKKSSDRVIHHPKNVSSKNAKKTANKEQNQKREQEKKQKMKALTIDNLRNKVKEIKTKIESKLTGNPYLYMDKKKIEEISDKLKTGSLYELLKDYRKQNPAEAYQEQNINKEYDNYLDDIQQELLVEDYREDADGTINAVQEYYGYTNKGRNNASLLLDRIKQEIEEEDEY